MTDLTLSYSFVPVNGHTSAVDVRRCSVFKVLKPSVSRFLGGSQSSSCDELVMAAYLSVTGLEAKMEESSNTVLRCSWRIVHDKPKSAQGQH